MKNATCITVYRHPDAPDLDCGIITVNMGFEHAISLKVGAEEAETKLKELARMFDEPITEEHNACFYRRYLVVLY